MDTGLPFVDSQTDFSRARRRAAISRIVQRLRRQPGDTNLVLPFEEVVQALGRSGERDLGVLSVPLDSIVGSVDRTREFDRRFRPTSNRLRPRWERVALAQRRGVAMPPISVYRIGDLHFVRDGHHRVSVARAMGQPTIEAEVTEVTTAIPPGPDLTARNLLLKSHERLFFERVPLEPRARRRVRVRDPWSYGDLAEAVEAWGFRAIQERRELVDRRQVAREWFECEFVPVVDMLEEGDLLEGETEAEAYMRLMARRYRLLRTHQWNDEILDELRRRPS